MTTPVAVVTGAGSGIGRAAALRLGRAGWRLVLVGRNESRLAETDALLAALPTPPEATELVPADLADGLSARAVIDATIECFGRIDALVNNAGAAEVVAIDETSQQLLEHTFAVNVFGPAQLITAAWPHFRAQHRGCVVNISSVAAFDPFPGFFVYAASKGALDSLTRSVALEGRSIGVRAFSINPGAVETPLLRAAFSTDVVAESQTLDPRGVAEVIAECVLGMRDWDNGRCIPVVRR